MTRYEEKKIAVYTAITNDYDHVGDHTFVDGVDYIFFTDGTSNPTQERWKVIDLPDLSHLDPRRVAKLPKLFPHYFSELQNYDCVIWIDGDMQIKNENFIQDIMEYLDDSGMVISPHFDMRDCAYGEATIRPSKMANEPIDQQVAFYKEDGFPEHFGLYECGVIVWDMNHEGARNLGQTWYINNLLWSYQDQVSLPYALWRTGFKPSILPKSFRDFEWVCINAHKGKS